MHILDGEHVGDGPERSGVGRPGAERWGELLDAIDVEELARDFEHRVRRLDWYRDEVLTVSELRGSATASFRSVLRSMDPRVDRAGAKEELLEIAAHVGVSRARLGTPVEMLLHAIRIDFTVLWNHVVSIATRDDAVLLVARTEQIWGAVEEYAARTHHAYIAERARMTQEADAVRRARIATLFGAAGRSPEALAEVAAALGVRCDDDFQVAVADDEHVDELRAAIVQGELRGATVFTHAMGEATVAFWRRDGREGAAASEIVRRVRGVACAFAEHVAGLADVAPAARTCRELLDVVVAGEGAISMADAWARLARVRLSASGQRLDADVAQALAVCTDAERDRLVEAVCGYLRSGSVHAAAAAAFCHRNTLMNRLRRFRELTGIDVSVPQQAARLVVAWS
ncbi:PucR family transcriptional regulator [Pseudoclavibacter chungangensis]|uniref:PucR family transcriptional regulator n=1 Tax=Pseudoclavibacter chungangensis TaxID=587635 RepID=A0A7J5C396_9MICO|nr:helix-turn-helix domain-containing protein [Pseudoclavibacter chungangensis]KAB1662307.1 PucR family transcriptional regulator [Pseudoclavibacter chungangensis]NYJ65516.1 hypothetical protein [Pseudoclavibacter chungangensis]